MLKYNNQMVNACKIALIQGIHKPTEFKNFVFNQVGFGCQAKIIEHVSISASVPDRAKRDRELFSRLESAIKTLPRGHFSIVEKLFDDGTKIFKTVLSDGTGKIAAGGKFNTYSNLPSETEILQMMFDYEIFECRKYCEAISAIESGRQAITEYQLKHGQHHHLNDVRHQSSGKSTALILFVDYEKAVLRVLLTRRGEKKQVIIPADEFVFLAGLEKLPNHTPKKKAEGHADLFSYN